MFAIAGALLGLILLLATLQYQWLGQISGAERERMTATLNTRASAFGEDFDRELTRAYLLFQLDPMQQDQSAAGGIVDALRPLAGDRALPADDQGRLRRPLVGGGQRVGPAAALQSVHAIPRAGRLARVAVRDSQALSSPAPSATARRGRRS